MPDRIMSEGAGETLADKIKDNAAGVSLVGQGILNLISRIETLEAALGGGSSGIGGLLQIDMPDEFVVNDTADAPSVIAESVNVNGFTGRIGTSAISWKKPTIIVPEIQWSNTVDDNYNITGTGTVMVTFGASGAISKEVTFKKPGEGKIYAVKLGDTSAKIDTGIAGNYSYRFHVKGHTNGASMCVFLDAFVDSTARTTARVLGSSNKLQHMWYANKEQTPTDISFKKMFEMTHGANYLHVKQGTTVLNPTITGQTTSGNVGATIKLMNTDAGGAYGNAILSFAEILDSSSNVVARYEPFKIVGDEVVFINLTGLTAQQIYDIVQNGDSAEQASHILRPSSGTLIEVTKAEDDAI